VGLAIGPPSSARSPELVRGYRYSVVAVSILWFESDDTVAWASVRK
jgi:hypothetical protein